MEATKGTSEIWTLTQGTSLFESSEEDMGSLPPAQKARPIGSSTHEEDFLSSEELGSRDSERQGLHQY